MVVEKNNKKKKKKKQLVIISHFASYLTSTKIIARSNRDHSWRCHKQRNQNTPRRSVFGGWGVHLVQFSNSVCLAWFLPLFRLEPCRNQFYDTMFQKVTFLVLSLMCCILFGPALCAVEIYIVVLVSEQYFECC